MIGPFLWLIYLLTIGIPNARCLVADDSLCLRFDVNIGFSDNDQIFMKICTSSKVMEQKTY